MHTFGKYCTKHSICDSDEEVLPIDAMVFTSVEADEVHLGKISR